MRALKIIAVALLLAPFVVTAEDVETLQIIEVVEGAGEVARDMRLLAARLRGLVS